jgi:hypothetical protein
MNDLKQLTKQHQSLAAKVEKHVGQLAEGQAELLRLNSISDELLDERIQNPNTGIIKRHSAAINDIDRQQSFLAALRASLNSLQGELDQVDADLQSASKLEDRDKTDAMAGEFSDRHKLLIDQVKNKLAEIAAIQIVSMGWSAHMVSPHGILDKNYKDLEFKSLLNQKLSDLQKVIGVSV